MARISHPSLLRVTLLAGSIYAIVPSVGAESTMLEPDLDTSIYSESGNLSNALGNNVFCGRTANVAIRRALLRFPIAENLPAGAEITSVTLEMVVSLAQSPTSDIRLHRMLAPWGEGTSLAAAPGGTGTTATVGDATWTNRVHPDTPWQTAGGDFVEVASASTTVGGTGTYAWSGPGLLDDVVRWAEAPAENYGWIMVGTEGTAQTAKRFHSREEVSSALRPRLLIEYSLGPEMTGTDIWMLE